MATITSPTATDASLDTVATTLKLLADPTRLRIFALLMQGVQCNCEISDTLGISANLISHHLRVLRQAKLVDVERDASDARWVYYSINRATLQGISTLLGDFFDPARIASRQPACGPSRG